MPLWLPSRRPTRSIACCKLGRMVNWCKHGRLLIEWPQEWTGMGPVYSPVSRHEIANRKQKEARTNNHKQDTQHKTKHSNRGPSRNKTWQVPVYELIPARGDNIVSSQLGMAAEPNRRTKTSPGHTRRWAKQQVHQRFLRRCQMQFCPWGLETCLEAVPFATAA